MSRVLKDAIEHTGEYKALEGKMSEKRDWGRLQGVLNLAIVNKTSSEYEAMQEQAKSYHDPSKLGDMLSNKRNVKPNSNVEFNNPKTQAWIDDDETEVKKIFGVDTGLQIKGESGWGAEMLAAALGELSPETQQKVREHNASTAMFGGSCVYGYNRIRDNLKTQEQMKGISTPSTKEVRQALLRCRFLPMVNGPYGVTPIIQQLYKSSHTRQHICERPTEAYTYYVRPKTLFSEGHQFDIPGVKDEPETEAHHAAEGLLGTRHTLHGYEESTSHFVGHVAPYPFTTMANDVLRRRVICDFNVTEPTADNLVKINNYARAGAKYGHKSMCDVLAEVLADAARLQYVRKAQNSRFATSASLLSSMPSYEADELMASTLRTFMPQAKSEWSELRRSNPQYFIDTLVCKTDKYSLSKLFDLQLRLYVEATKCEQIVISQWTQGLQDAMKRRSISEAHAYAIKQGWPSNALYTHTTFGYTFAHGGQDNLMHYLDGLCTAGQGVTYIHNGDDNLVIVRTDYGLCVFAGDLKTYDWTQTMEVKKPVIDQIAFTNANIDPSGVALWVESMTEMLTQFHGKENATLRDPNPSGKNFFAEVGDATCDILLNRVCNRLRANQVHKERNPCQMVSDVFVNECERMGYRAKVESVDYLDDVFRMHDYLQQKPVTYLGYTHYTPPLQADQKYLSSRCYIDILRFHSSVLYNSSAFEPDHKLYRLHEATRLGGMLLQAGTPPRHLEAHYDKMKEVVLDMLSRVGDVEWPVEEDDMVDARAPGAYVRGKKLKRKKLLEVYAVAVSDEINEALQSVEGITNALLKGTSRIWTDKTKSLARLQAVFDEEDDAQRDSWADEIETDVLETHIRRPAQLSEHVREAAATHALAVDMYTMDWSEVPFTNLPPIVLQDALELKRYTSQELIKRAGVVTWDNWGRVSADPVTRAEAARRRKLHNKQRKETAALLAEEAGHKVKAKGANQGERDTDRLKGSLKTVKEEAEHDPFDSYSAAKNMGPNRRKKK